jgi:hypothetical protein
MKIKTGKEQLKYFFGLNSPLSAIPCSASAKLTGKEQAVKPEFTGFVHFAGSLKFDGINLATKILAL